MNDSHNNQAVAAPAPSSTSTMAIISLIVSILGFGTLGFVGSLVAVILGHIARSEIKKSNGQLGGGGIALAGLILGYIGLVVGLLLFLIVGGIGLLAILL